MERKFTLNDIDRLLADKHKGIDLRAVNNPDALTEFKGMIDLRDLLKNDMTLSHSEFDEAMRRDSALPLMPKVKKMKPWWG